MASREAIQLLHRETCALRKSSWGWGESRAPHKYVVSRSLVQELIPLYTDRYTTENAHVAFFAERDVGLNLAISYSQGTCLSC
jgi:hypothetical protein